MLQRFKTQACCALQLDRAAWRRRQRASLGHCEQMLWVRPPYRSAPSCRLSVRLEGLGQVLQHRQQLLLLQGGAVGPGQRQVSGHHLAVCAQTQVES